MKSLLPLALLLIPYIGWAQGPSTVAVPATTQVAPASSDLFRVVQALRQAQNPDVVTVSRTGNASSMTSRRAAQLLAFVDGKPATDEQLNAMTLSSVREVALRFDPTYATLYGSVGAQGIIVVTTKQQKSDAKK